MSENNIVAILIWLGELTFSSWVLSYGAEHLSMKYGAKFVGRTLLSVATTLPEIAIVIYAAAEGSYGIALGAGLGSNLLMMTLGLAIMLLIATTRLSKAPLKGIDVSTFKLDKIFLIVTAILGLILFIDGYNFIDGIIFAGLFVAYLIIALYEMKVEKSKGSDTLQQNINQSEAALAESEVKLTESAKYKNQFGSNKHLLKAIIAFVAGTVGILIGAEPFIHALQGFSAEVGISPIILAIIISPIAGEMPEKISMMILARKGAAGASIAIANVLGSKILNNTLLLAVAVFGAMFHAGFYSHINATHLLSYQMILVTTITIIALIPMFRREIGLKVGLLLAGLYVVSIFIQFILPQDLNSH